MQDWKHDQPRHDHLIDIQPAEATTLSFDRRSFLEYSEKQFIIIFVAQHKAESLHISKGLYSW